MNSKTLFYMACVTVASMQAAESNAKAANKKHMNVLFIMADDLRPEMVMMYIGLSTIVGSCG